MIASLSQTSIGMWAKCPEQFRRRFIERQVIPPAIAARIGSGVHGGAEVSNRAKIDSGKGEPKSVVVDAAVQTYKDMCKRGVWFAQEDQAAAKIMLGEGVDKTASLAGLYSDEVDTGIDPVAVEESLVIHPPELALPLTGIVDWRDRDPKRWADIKTSSKSWTQDAADASIQATLYPRLIEAATGHLPTALSFEVLVGTKTPKHQTVTTVRTDDDWRLLLIRARLMLDMIQAGLFPPAPPGSWWCNPKWCGYWYTCPHQPAHRKIIPKKPR